MIPIENLYVIQYYYRHNIGVGKTWAMIHGIKDSQRHLAILCSTIAQGKMLVSEYGLDSDVKILSIRDQNLREKIMGWNGILLIEPSTQEEIIDACIDISRAKDLEVEEIKAKANAWAIQLMAKKEVF